MMFFVTVCFRKIQRRKASKMVCEILCDASSTSLLDYISHHQHHRYLILDVLQLQKNKKKKLRLLRFFVEEIMANAKLE